jgi:ribosomal protein L14E/L6E/L27E
MRIIRIVADGVPVDVYDEADTDIEEATKKLFEMVKGDKIISVIGKNSSAIVRPSSVSAINIIDDPNQQRDTKRFQQMKETDEKEEQNIDMICDVEEGE